MICPPSFSQPDTQVASNYMGIQTDINDKMRAILIDWLVEVHLSSSSCRRRSSSPTT